MANKYTRKGKLQEETPQEDEFVGFWEQAYEKLKPQMRNIAIAAGALVVVAGGAWAASTMSNSSRAEATDQFARAVRIHDADLKPEDDKDQDKSKKKPADEDDVPRFKTAKERAEATLAELDKLEKDKGGTGVAKQARAFRAGVLFELGRYDEAKKAAADLVADAGKDDPLAAIAREDEGLSYEIEGKLDDALKVYKELAGEGKAADFLRDRAQFDEARVLAKKGDAAGARELYKKLLDKTPPTGSLHEEVQNRLSQLGGSGG